MLGGAALVYALFPCHHSAKLLSKHVPTTIKIVLAPDCSSTYNDCTPPLHLCCHDLHHIHALQSMAGEGTACGITNISFNELPVRFMEVSPFMEASSCDANMAHMVYCLQTSGMTDKDCLLKCFTCCQLRCLKNRPDWDEVFDAQLDSHCKVSCIGILVPQPTLIDDYPPNIPQQTKQLGLIYWHASLVTSLSTIPVKDIPSDTVAMINQATCPCHINVQFLDLMKHTSGVPNIADDLLD